MPNVRFLYFLSTFVRSDPNRAPPLSKVEKRQSGQVSVRLRRIAELVRRDGVQTGPMAGQHELDEASLRGHKTPIWSSRKKLQSGQVSTRLRGIAGVSLSSGRVFARSTTDW